MHEELLVVLWSLPKHARLIEAHEDSGSSTLLERNLIYLWESPSKRLFRSMCLRRKHPALLMDEKPTRMYSVREPTHVQKKS